MTYIHQQIAEKRKKTKVILYLKRSIRMITMSLSTFSVPRSELTSAGEPHMMITTEWAKMERDGEIYRPEEDVCLLPQV